MLNMYIDEYQILELKDAENDNISAHRKKSRYSISPY